ncbi:MAG: L,D-transpeptidase [Solirubrobacterales bacterium]|nr:L,D-transpeptidase [Solirubrobacterales bacterium]
MNRSVASRAFLIALALIPAIPILAGFLITSHSASAGPAVAGYNPTAQTSQLTQHPPSEQGATVAQVVQRTIMRAAPGGRKVAVLRTRTEFGSPQTLWVVDRAPGWLGVISPLAGNGRTGWIPSSAAQLSPDEWRIQVSLSRKRLTIFQGAGVRQRYTVAIGMPSAPTPTGRFAVTDRLSTGDPSGPYGCCILALTARSPHAIQGWNGGDRIAIHSTPDASSIGEPVSHGCVRLSLAAGRWMMNHIPLGTPTLITT